MSNKKRQSKRKIKIPIKYDDSICDLGKSRVCNDREDNKAQAAGSEDIINGGCKNNEGDEVRVAHVEPEKGREEVIVNEFPTLNEVFSKASSTGKQTPVNTVIDTIDSASSVQIDNELNASAIPNSSNKKIVNAKLSFACIVKNNTEYNNTLELIPTRTEEGREVVIFEEEFVIEGSKKWELTLCGYFIGFRMQYAEIKYNLSRMWGRFGLSDIIVHNGLYVFKFKNDDRMNKVIKNSIWLVRNKHLLVQKWNTNICIDKKEPEVLPVWVKLFNLPLEAWNNKGFSVVASGLGKLVIMDQTTTKMCNESRGRLRYARVLVEVSARDEFKNKIEICYKNAHNVISCTKYVSVEYDWMPPKCSHCKIFDIHMLIILSA